MKILLKYAILYLEIIWIIEKNEIIVIINIILKLIFYVKYNKGVWVYKLYI